jgi:ABC-type transporter Mla subunit MlaD
LIISESETDEILQTAMDCAEGECSIDDVSGLIDELMQRRQEMEKRLEKIMNMVATLQQLNEQPNRDTDQVRAFVKDLLRVFDVNDPTVAMKKVQVPPIGYSGDVGSGATTAYDALSPKPWKPTK